MSETLTPCTHTGVSISDKFIAYCMRIPSIVNEKQREEIRSYYCAIGRDAMYEYAKNKKILPYVAHSLMNIGCDHEFWENVHTQYANRNQEIITLLDRVFTSFDKAGMNKICVAENFGAILLSGTCVGCFCSGDVDLYCDELDLDKLDTIMKSYGFSWSDRHARKKSFAREYKGTNVISEEFWLNFQWKPMTRKKTHLYDQRSILRRYHTLFEYTMCYLNTRIRIFSAEAQTYLNCIHIASGHYYILSPEIRLYVDIDRLAQNLQINWDEVRRWAIADKLGFRVDAVYELSKMLLNTPIPDKAFTVDIRNAKLRKFVGRLIDIESLTLRRQNRESFQWLIWWFVTEVYSDGTALLPAILKRVDAIIMDWK